MNALKLYKLGNQHALLSWSYSAAPRLPRAYTVLAPPLKRPRNNLRVKASSAGAGAGGEGQNSSRRTFLTLEEAGLVEISGLDAHERFLCRLTISSLNLLKVISEQEGCPIEELNAGRICDWFLKDKLKREQNLESAVLQWDSSEFQF
nr:receptor-interacting protein, putative [Ipomoea batatas]GMD93042.1 receptor-interacting protein, putative [Ipomoea batatas]